MLNEHLITFAEAARTLPGGGVHIATVHRWHLRGVGGIRLESLMRGGVRYTSTEAIARFIANTTAAANGEQPVVQTAKQRQRAIDAAEKELAASGI